jgi:hypothetical protein
MAEPLAALHLRLPSGLKEQVRDLARENKRSLNHEVAFVLAKHVAEAAAHVHGGRAQE